MIKTGKPLHVGAILADARAWRALSKVDIADALTTTRVTIWRIEGNPDPPESWVRAYAQALSMYELLPLCGYVPLGPGPHAAMGHSIDNALDSLERMRCPIASRYRNAIYHKLIL